MRWVQFPRAANWVWTTSQNLPKIDLTVGADEPVARTAAFAVRVSSASLLPDSFLLPKIFDRRLEVAEQARGDADRKGGGPLYEMRLSSGRGVVAVLKVESGGRRGF
jgi:hypothetical protein